MKNIEFVSSGDQLNENLCTNDNLADFLFEFGYEVPKVLQKENELLQQMINSIKSLNQILEGLNIPDKDDFAPEWITTKEVLLKYGISLRTQSAWRKSGKLHFSLVELKIYYKKRDLEIMFSQKYHRNNVPKAIPESE